MRIALIVNPASGAGRASIAASVVLRGLHAAGFAADRHDVLPGKMEATRALLVPALAGADVVAVVGGDGTVHHALPMLVEAGKPLYHVPLGTENLFARAMGSFFGNAHERNAEQLAAWARAGRHRRLDVMALSAGNWSGLGAIMATLGPDASVVRRLARVRSGPISHLSYVRPILGEVMTPHLPVMSVEVEGVRVVREQSGWCVLANLPNYARGINPARDASASDGLIDVAFFPARSTLEVAGWMLRCATRMQFEHESALAGAIVHRGHEVIVRSHGVVAEGLALQIDGDLAHHASSETVVRCRCLASCLPVLSAPNKAR